MSFCCTFGGSLCVPWMPGKCQADWRGKVELLQWICVELTFFSCFESLNPNINMFYLHPLHLHQLLHKLSVMPNCCDVLAVWTCFIQAWELPGCRKNPPTMGPRTTKAPSKFSPESTSSLCSRLLWRWPSCRQLMRPSCWICIVFSIGDGVLVHNFTMVGLRSGRSWWF